MSCQTPTQYSLNQPWLSHILFVPQKVHCNTTPWETTCNTLSCPLFITTHLSPEPLKQPLLPLLPSHSHFHHKTSQTTHPPNMPNPKKNQTSKHKWQREKFWAFILLAANRMLNHDFLPPWGFEFLLCVNPQAWWYHYSHYSKHERENHGEQDDNESLSDESSVGDVSNHHDYQDKQQNPGLADCNCSNGMGSTSSSHKFEQSETASLLPRFEWEEDDTDRWGNELSHWIRGTCEKGTLHLHISNTDTKPCPQCCL
jgi:hypothetical protein